MPATPNLSFWNRMHSKGATLIYRNSIALKKFLPVLTAGLVVYILLFTSLESISTSEVLYQRNYQRFDVLEIPMVKKYPVKALTKDIVWYLAGLLPDLNVHGYFTPKEISHMADVRKLYDLGRVLRLVALAGLAAIFIQQRKRLPLFSQAFRKSYQRLLVGFLIFAGLAGAFFSKTFIWFHYIFFRNMDWVLDPTESIIINLMPQQFFSSMALWIIAFFTALAGSLLAVCALRKSPV